MTQKMYKIMYILSSGGGGSVKHRKYDGGLIENLEIQNFRIIDLMNLIIIYTIDFHEESPPNLLIQKIVEFPQI